MTAGILNLSLNFAFVKYFSPEYKLDGVILSTIIAFILVQIPWESYVMFSAFFNSEQGRFYWQRQFRLFLLAVMLSSVTWCAAHLVTLTGIPGLIAKAAAAGTFSGGFLFAFYQPQIIQLVKKALQKG